MQRTVVEECLYYVLFMFLYCTLHISFIERRLDDLKPLTILDPNLLPIIMFICPMPEVPQLLLQVPPSLSITWLQSCYFTEITKYLNRDEVRDLYVMNHNVFKINLLIVR